MRRADARRAHMPPPSHAMVRVLLLIVCLSLGTSASAGDPAPSVRIVPTDHPTIMAAIDASVTGDEIIVKPGVYDESLVIDGAFALTIRAQKPGSVRITGTDGIIVSNSIRVSLMGLVVEDAVEGAVLFRSSTSECRLDRVSVTAGNDYGITLFGDRHVATRCSVVGGDFFAYHVEGSDTVLSGCSASNGDISGFLDGEGHVVIGCKFKDMNVGFIVIATDALIANNTLTKINGTAIDLVSENVTVRGNRIRRVAFGIDADAPATIVGNRLTKVDDIGIDVDSSNVSVADNVISSARVGLNVDIGVDVSRVVGNKIRGSTETDIVDGGTNTVLVDNKFKTFVLTGT